MSEKVKIAAVQMDPEIMRVRDNLDRLLGKLKEAAGKGAGLVVFPECAITGYVFASREEALPFMEAVPGPSTEEIAAACAELGVHAVFGTLEKEGERCYNAAVLVGPGGLVGKYRKVHLPFLGIDRFLDPGDRPFAVHRTPVGNIGMHICYDCNFPESARTQALLGAEILALPTNWPQGREKVAEFVVRTRAFENRVNLVATDRVGRERGVRFIGSSQIISAGGDVLARAGSEDEETIYAEVDLAEARQKRVVVKAGEFEANFIADRRPEMYGRLAEGGAPYERPDRP